MRRSRNLIWIFALIGAGTSPLGDAAANDWDNGSGDGRWSNGVNWSGNLEPSSGSTALFPAGFPNGDAEIILDAGETAVLVGFGDNYVLRNAVSTSDSATLALGDAVLSGVVNASAGKSAEIRVRLNSDGLTKTGAGTVTLSRRTDIDGPIEVEAGTLILRDHTQSSSGAIAIDAGQTGVITVDSPTALWSTFGLFATVSLGNATLNITGGAGVEVGGMTLGGVAGNVATINVSGAGSTLSSGLIRMGSSGATGTLNITGGVVTARAGIQSESGNNTITLDGGTLDAGNGNLGSADVPVTNLNFRSGTLKNVRRINGGAGLDKTTAGTLTLEGANDYSGPTTVSGGTLKLSGDGSFASSRTISLAAGTTLDVAGVTSGLNFSVASFALQSRQTLVGDGTVVGDMVNHGVISPGSSPGTLQINGALTQSNFGTLEIEVGAVGQVVQHDLLSIAGFATFDGQLELRLTGGANPLPSQTFAVADASTLVGAFDNVANGERLTTVDGLGSFVVNYGVGSAFDPNQIVLSGFLSTALTADFDADNDVDGDDFIQWKDDFGENALSDADNDGDSDGADFLAWQRQLGSGLPAPAWPVPEPGSLYLLLISGWQVMRFHRWRRPSYQLHKVGVSLRSTVCAN